jgi:integrase
LRHSAASTAIEAGAPLELVGAMLGHRSVITTQRYRHIADAALRETAQRLGDAQADKLRRGRIENAAEAARVVVLPRAGGPSAGSRRRQR